MSDNLISRKALYERVEKSMYENPHSDSEVRQVHNHEHKHFLCMIMREPTVFDKEEVIKALQLEKENAEANYRRESNKDDYDESYADYWLGKVAAYEVAIDIVKKGGI